MNKLIYIMAVFMVFILAMVLYITWAVNEKPEPNYYEKDLHYQRHKDSLQKQEIKTR
jgi:flagellar basal body-associated protein FliL